MAPGARRFRTTMVVLAVVLVVVVLVAVAVGAVWISPLDDPSDLRVEAPPHAAARRGLEGDGGHRVTAPAAPGGARGARRGGARRLGDGVPGTVPQPARRPGRDRGLLGRGVGRDRGHRRGRRRCGGRPLRLGGGVRGRPGHRVRGLPARSRRSGGAGRDPAPCGYRHRRHDLERHVPGDVVLGGADPQHLLLVAGWSERPGVELGDGGRPVPRRGDRGSRVPGSRHEPRGAR